MAIGRWITAVRMRLRSLARGRAAEAELHDELQFHIEQATAEHVSRGMTPEAARRAALLSVAGIDQRKEECREARGLGFVRSIGRDAGLALRLLRRRPSFSLAAIGTLALGIGANAVIFAIVKGVLLDPLPFRQSERIVLLSSAPNYPVFGGSMMGLSEEHFAVFRQGDRLLESSATFGTGPVNTSGAGEPLRIRRASVTAEFFDVLRVSPARGRAFAPDIDDPSRDRLLVISDNFWRTQFAGDENVVGRSIALDGVSHEVVGVMPPGFTFPEQADGWALFDARPQGGNSFFRPVIGRLKPGVTREQVRDELEALTLPADDARANWVVAVQPLLERFVGNVRQPLVILAGTVVFVLLVACANVANLFLIRNAERDREMAVRAALGAGRWRIARQLLTENLVVAALGAFGGALLAYWAVPAIVAAVPPDLLPRAEGVAFDRTVMWFTTALAGVTALLFGLLPALQATRTQAAMTAGTRSVTGRRERLHGAIVVTEIALSLMLLVGATLMIRSLMNLRAVDPGFDPASTITATVDLPAATYQSPEAARQFHAVVIDRLRNVPGVQAVGAINAVPFGDWSLRGGVALDGGRAVPDGFTPGKSVASDGYFEAMGIRLVRGRAFAGTDGPGADRVAVVSESAARALWPGEDAIGRRISLRTPPRSDADWLTVIGIVEDVRQHGLTGDLAPAVYQSSLQADQVGFLTHMTFVVRTPADPGGLGPAIHAAIRDVDPLLPLPAMRSMQSFVDAWTNAPVFQVRALGSAAVAALVLTVVGLYSVLAYAVAGRTRELAIRLALGAMPTSVVWMVVRRTLILTAAGLVIGVAGALALTRWMATLLFDITPTDPPTFALVAATLALAALAAAAIPAWRATRVSPTVALRAE